MPARRRVRELADANVQPITKDEYLTIPEAIKQISNIPDRELAWSFFACFSRFEYALKRSKEFINKDLDRAEADWDAFATKYDSKWKKAGKGDLEAAVEYFITNPPKKQKRDGDELKWEAFEKKKSNEPFLKWLLLAIRTVRNNLFHGGKFTGEPIPEPSRDRDLLKHSLVILEECLALDNNVKNIFRREEH